MGVGELRIREARARDGLELLALRRAVLAEGKWFIGTTVTWSVEDEERTLAAVRLAPNQTVQVARLDGRIVGAVQLTCPPFNRTQHVVKLEILVAEHARGAGVGRALMKAALDWADEAPIEKIGLAVFADNDRAIGLYRAFGFEEEGRRQREYRLADGTYRDDVLFYRFV